MQINRYYGATFITAQMFQNTEKWSCDANKKFFALN